MVHKTSFHAHIFCDLLLRVALKAIHERLGSLLIFLEDGQLDDEGLRRAMRLLKSFAFDLRAAAEKLRYQETAIGE